jgi:hypothetical protein
MHRRNRISTGVAAALAALLLTVAGAAAFDESKYPDLKGSWNRIGQPRWAPANDGAPLTPEYQKVFDWNNDDKKLGGHGWETSWMCLSPGMPRIMNAYGPMEVVVTPATTYILISHIHDNRRIYTDGRGWPKDPDPGFKGYSVGNWIDTDGDGRYDTLEVETRYMKGQRSYDTSGLPLHADNQTVVKEKIYLDKQDPNLLWDEITTIDDALTRPWTVKKKYVRNPDPKQNWAESICAESNPHVRIQNDNYMLSADGHLMPAKKGQKPPDLRYFKN